MLKSKLYDPEIPPYSSRIYVVIVSKPDDPRFLESCRKEVQGLLYRGSYVVVNECDIPPGATVLRSRVHNTIKTDANGIKTFKSRLIIQGLRDTEKGSIVNETPTILHYSRRLVLSLGLTIDFSLWSRDVR